jgi:hypothetical protein
MAFSYILVLLGTVHYFFVALWNVSFVALVTFIVALRYFKAKVQYVALLLLSGTFVRALRYITFLVGLFGTFSLWLADTLSFCL